MSQEERILRLENAMSALAELAADHQRLAVQQHRVSVEQQRRTAQLEESFLTLVKLAGSHSESIDELRAAQADSEHKIAALADKMIHLAESHQQLTESQERLTESQERLAEAQKQLAESQTHSDRRLDALIDIVRQWGNGRG